MQDERDLLQTGFRYAYALTHNHHDAEDLVQDAWIKLRKVTRKAKSKSLLFVTIRNLYIDGYRHNKLLVIESIDDQEQLESYDDNLIAQLLDRDLAIILAQLRSEEREVIYLSCVEGYTAQEIAKLTEKSRNTILSLIYRAKGKLLQAVANENRVIEGLA